MSKITVGRWPKNELVGRRYNRLVVVAASGADRSGKRRWLCNCDCGKTAIVITGELVSGGTASCGCAARKHPTIAVFLRDNAGRDGCWEYPSHKDENGYAEYHEDGCPPRAHRAAFQHVNGPIPEGLNVLHHCDNPPCCNPEHLFSGTDMDNVHDAMAKDRHSRGERNGAAKLTPEQVRAIRADHRRQVDIAADYGIVQTTVSAIKCGVNWRRLHAD